MKFSLAVLHRHYLGRGGWLCYRMYFQETMLASTQPPAITHAQYYYGSTGVALVWQVAFGLIAIDPPRYHAMLVPAALENIAFGTGAVVLYLQHRLAPLMLVAGCVDLLFSGLFLLPWWQLRTSATVGQCSAFIYTARTSRIVDSSLPRAARRAPAAVRLRRRFHERLCSRHTRRRSVASRCERR